MPGSTFVLVEAVNLYDTLLDTEQLSVIRGGSFAIRSATENIKKKFSDDLEEISTGASRGLFRISRDSKKSIITIVEDLTGYLHTHSLLRHFTILVVPCTANNFLEAERKLNACLRFKQLRSITVATDPLPAGGLFADTPCELEGRRARPKNPQEKYKKKVQGQSRALSESVFARLKHGRKLRGSYYENELEKYNIPSPDGLADAGFVDDLQSLAGGTSFTHLNDKIAVFYADGNGFGATIRQILKGIEGCSEAVIKKQQEIDLDIRHQRAGFLYCLLKEFLSDSSDDNAPFRFSMTEDEKGKKSGNLRLETLLWGGDEMMMVVPAWLGFDLVQLFYQMDWRLDGTPVTFAGGLVFCSVKTPISKVTALARELADRIKASPQGKERNLFDYAVLESIDYPVEPSLDEFFTNRYGAFGHYQCRCPLPPAAQWDNVREELRTLLQDESCLSRRQAYILAGAIGRHAFSNSKERQDFLLPKNGPKLWSDVCDKDTGEKQKSIRNESLGALERRLLQVSKDKEKLKTSIENTLSKFFDADKDDPQSRAAMWLHLVELWDYLVPTLEQDTSGGATA